MNKIKNIFSGMVKSTKEALNRFPITTIVIFILTIIITFFIKNIGYRDVINHIIITGIFWVVGVWLSEAIIEDKKDLKKYVGIIIGFIMALIIDIVISKIAKGSRKESAEIVLRWVVAYWGACFLSTIYVLAKKSKVGFEKYILNLFLNIKRASIIYIIVSICVLFLYGIFKILIFNDFEFEFISKLLSLFAGFYYIPVCVNSFANIEAEDTKFNKVVFLNVLMPLLIVAISIIYMYIIKIFCFTEIPKSELFAICSAIFACAFPIYIINKNYYQKDSITAKLVKAIPYLCIPFIFLQIYSMGIRILEYGLSIPRYIACVLIICEIIAIMLAILKAGKYLKEFILSMAIVIVIISISPFNYEAIPMKSQRRIVEKYIAKGQEFNSYSKEDKRKFAGAYQYIEDNEKYNDVKLSQTEKEQLSSYNTYISRYSNNNDDKAENVNTIEHMNFSKQLDVLDISEYSKIYQVHTDYSSDNQKANSLKLSTNKDNNKITVNLEEYINNLIESNQISKVSANKAFTENTIIKIDDKTDMYVTYINVGYYEKNKECKDIIVKGYLLEK